MPWVPDSPEANTQVLHKHDAPWDQFEANRKFGYRAWTLNKEARPFSIVLPRTCQLILSVD